jgi:hypothetical protein
VGEALTRRAAGCLLAGAAAVVGAAATFVTAPRLTLLNEGLRLRYPWPAVTAAAVTMVALAALAVLLRPRPARGLAALSALLGCAFALERATYLVAADAVALTSAGLVERSRIAWPEVRQVQGDGRTLRVSGFGENQIVIQTAGLRPQDRATLERTVSRRVQEAGPAAGR